MGYTLTVDVMQSTLDLLELVGRDGDTPGRALLQTTLLSAGTYSCSSLFSLSPLNFAIFLLQDTYHELSLESCPEEGGTSTDDGPMDLDLAIVADDRTVAELAVL